MLSPFIMCVVAIMNYFSMSIFIRTEEATQKSDCSDLTKSYSSNKIYDHCWTRMAGALFYGIWPDCIAWNQLEGFLC